MFFDNRGKKILPSVIVRLKFFLNEGSYDSVNHFGHRRRFRTCSLIIKVKIFFQVLQLDFSLND
jgi:hypothetical protein